MIGRSWLSGALLVVCMVGLGGVVGLGGCSKSEDRDGVASTPDKAQKKGGESVDSQSGDPMASSQATAQPVPPGDPKNETELDSIAMPAPHDCVRSCEQRNQMRAEAPEKITADCTSSCRKTCLEHCDASAEGRSPQIGEACRKDCERQLGPAAP